MKTLITGGAGFIGSHLVDRLINEGHSVVVVDNLSTGKEENLNPKAKFYKIDICDSEISKIFQEEKPEIVFHFAAQIDVRKSVENPIKDAEINILGSLNILENCKNFEVEKIIFSSTGGAIYGDAEIIPTPETHSENPESPYGITKLIIEKYLGFYKKTYNLNYVCLRLGNVYGPRQNFKGEAGVVAIFSNKLLKNEQPIIFGTGSQTRDFIYVNDVVDSVLEVLNQVDCNNVIYNIGTGTETKISDIYQLILKKIGKEIIPIFEPAKSGDLKRSCLDCARAKQELKWSPKYNLEKGLRETVDWFRHTKI